VRADAAPDVLMDVLNCYKVQEQCDAIRDALDDERRQTQWRMIAALYWRAGELLHVRALLWNDCDSRKEIQSMGYDYERTARRMEAACAR